MDLLKMLVDHEDAVEIIGSIYFNDTAQIFKHTPDESDTVRPGSHQEHRNYRAYRCRKDDDDGAYAVL